MDWIDLKDRRPESGVEVLVWVEGKRGPAWRNNHHLVAYMGDNGDFWEERHPSDFPLPVIAWKPLTIPFDDPI